MKSNRHLEAYRQISFGLMSGSRDKAIVTAARRHGYSQMEVADQLGLHYSTTSRIIKVIAEQQK